MQNPLTTNQNNLLQARKHILAEYPEATFDVREVQVKSDYTRVTLVITTEKRVTSACHGYAPSTHSVIEDTAAAEIAAAMFCCAELGISLPAQGTPLAIKKPPVLSVNGITKEALSKYKTTRDLMAALKELQFPDIEKVDAWRKREKAEGRRVHVHHIIEKILGKSKVIYVREEPKEEVTPPPAPRTGRAGSQARQIMAEMEYRGVTSENYSATPFTAQHKTLTEFCTFATEQEIQQLCEYVLSVPSTADPK